MKLMMVLLVLISRELLTPQWRALLAMPSYWWRDSWLKIAETQKMTASVVLALLSLLPIFLFAAVLFALQHSYAMGWQLVWAAIILVPVFIDRQLPTVLATYREQWSATERITKEEFDVARHQLFDTHIKELFAPLFWVFLLGVWGVLLVSFYYSCRICQEQTQNAELSEVAKKALWYLDWLPSQAIVLSFALVGQFMPTWRYWLTRWSDMTVTPQTLVQEAADIAEGNENQNVLYTENIVWLSALATYEALCLRVVMLWVILLVLQLL
jgi:AmpE protein